MNWWAKNRNGWLRRLAVVLLAGGCGLAGCGKKTASTEQGNTGGEATTPANKEQEGQAAGTVVTPTPAGTVPAQRDQWRQSFTDATRGADNPPDDQGRPPDMTVSNKSVYKILKEVTQNWDTILLKTESGQWIDYKATLETDLGEIEIKLLAEHAPNHVRNFVALAQAGYYDQLFFDRVLHEEVQDPNPEIAAILRLDAVEAGCPLGTGENASGSIGYWLKPECDGQQEPSLFEEGAVGACRGDEKDTGATRFYITLNKAPYLAGNYTVFGKVTRGLDIVRKIAEKPVIVDDKDRNGSRRPEKPVVIKKVTISTQVRAKPEG
jgi:cyclophilin family peptidyl-prolyl cis-trans isomerase